MANYATLKASISQVIKENGNKEITGAVMQTTLLAMVNSIASGYTFAGVATPSMVVGTPDENVFWIGGAGTYSNFGASTINVPTGCIGIFKYNGTFSSDIINITDELQYRTIFYGNVTILKAGTPYSKVINEITVGSSYSVNVKLQNFAITGNTDASILNGYYYGADFTIDSNGYTLGNTHYLVADIKNKTLSVVTGMSATNLKTAIDDEHKIVLLYNMWGRLYSPIASLAAELYDHYNSYAPAISTLQTNAAKALSRSIFYGNVTIMKAGADYGKVISSITAGSSNSALVKLNNFAITGNTESNTLSGYYFGSDFTIDSNGYNLGNTDYLVADIKNKTLSVVNSMFATNMKTALNDEHKIILLYNLWGRLYSPISSLAAELYAFYNIPSAVEPTTTIITVDAGGSGDYTSVREAVSSITDASAIKRYKIFVKNGTYNEIDIMTKDYVDIEGESKDEVILYANGMSTENSPADYNWHTEEYSDVPINTIPKAWKHLFIHMSNSTISNMTLKCNMCKYVIHQDSEPNTYEAIVKNCILIREENFSDNGTSTYDQGLQYLVGVGAKHGQFQRYYDCQFICNTKGLPVTIRNGAVIWHNWNGQTEKAGMTLENCSMFGVKHIISCTNLKSVGNDDEIILNGVVADSVLGNTIDCITNDYYDQHAGDRFCIHVSIEKCHKLDSVVLGVGNRMLANALNADTFVKKYTTTQFSKGQPVDVDNMTIATQAPFMVVAEDADANTFCYLCTGRTFNGLAVADTYAAGDNIYINNGKFTKVVNGTAVGVAAEAKTLETDGELLIIKN